MSAIYALYEHPATADRAYGALRRAGIEDRDITVISSEPFEDFAFSHRDKSLTLFRLAALGGVVGLVAGVLLTRETELAWPLVVGGMPVVAPWPNLVVTFELTMLGAILTTVISMLVAAGLPARGTKALYDPDVSDGKILVGVTLGSGRTPETIRDALESAGAGTIRTA
jgi:hypothetical protein